MGSFEETAKAIDEILVYSRRCAMSVMVPSVSVAPCFEETSSCTELVESGKCSGARRWALVVSPFDSRRIRTDREKDEACARGYAAIFHMLGIVSDACVLALVLSDLPQGAPEELEELGIEVFYDGAGLFLKTTDLGRYGEVSWAGDKPLFEGWCPEELQSAYDAKMKSEAWKHVQSHFSLRWGQNLGLGPETDPSAWETAFDILSFGHGTPPEFPSNGANETWPFDEWFRFIPSQTRWGREYDAHVEEADEYVAIWLKRLSEAGFKLSLKEFTESNRKDILDMARNLGIDEAVEAYACRKGSRTWQAALKIEENISGRVDWNSNNSTRTSFDEQYAVADLNDKEKLLGAGDASGFRTFKSLHDRSFLFSRKGVDQRIGLVVSKNIVADSNDKIMGADRLLAALCAFGKVPEDVGAAVFLFSQDASASLAEMVSDMHQLEVLYDEEGITGQVVSYPDLFHMEELHSSSPPFSPRDRIVVTGEVPHEIRKLLVPWAESILMRDIATKFISTAVIGQFSLAEFGTIVEMMSYGHYTLEVPEAFEFNSFVASHLFIQPNNIVEDVQEWNKIQEEVLSIAEIWHEKLKSSGVAPMAHGRLPGEESRAVLERLQESGRMLGIDECMEMFFEDGMPLEHILGYTPEHSMLF